MRSTPDSKLPGIGPASSRLGVRVPKDIPTSGTDLDAWVYPDTGGMSVTLDDPARMPLPRRPSSLGGRGKLPVWQLSVAYFPRWTLRVRIDPRDPYHGFVEPILPVRFDDYISELVSTRPLWVRVL